MILNGNYGTFTVPISQNHYCHKLWYKVDCDVVDTYKKSVYDITMKFVNKL